MTVCGVNPFNGERLKNANLKISHFVIGCKTTCLLSFLSNEANLIDFINLMHILTFIGQFFGGHEPIRAWTKSIKIKKKLSSHDKWFRFYIFVDAVDAQ